MRLIVLGIILMLSMGDLSAQNQAFIDAWTADINQYRETITAKHKDPFTKIEEKAFDQSCDELISRLSALNQQQVMVELCRIGASVGDAHTAIRLPLNRGYQVSTYWFSDGLRLVGAPAGNDSLLGAELKTVNGHPFEEVVDALASIIPHENRSQLIQQIPNLLINAEVLFGLGITSDMNSCRFGFSQGSSDQQEIHLNSLTLQQYRASAPGMAVVRPAKTMLANSRRGQIYWFTTLEKEHAVYVQYASCREQDGYPFKSFVKDVMAAIDSMDNPKLIIDLRANGGGNSAIFALMTRAIKKRKSLNKKDNLYVLIGRRTFSSAVLNAMELRNETEAILVGEPTGGKPNHFGEVKNDVLKNTGLTFTWSVKYFTTTDGDPESVIPDVAVGMTFEEYAKGEDRVLERVLSRK